MSMFRRSLPVLVLVLTAALSWAAIEYMPATLYFPIVRYAIGGVDFAVLKRGETDVRGCERTATQVADAVRASCPTCSYSQQCVSGIGPKDREALSTAPLALSSLRSADGAMTMTVSAPDPKVAMTICKFIEAQSAAGTPGKRLRCFPSATRRS